MYWEYVQNPHCYMDDYRVCIASYSMAHCVYLFNIWSIELHTLHLNKVLHGMLSSESVHDRERHVAMSLYKLKALGMRTYLN